MSDPHASAPGHAVSLTGTDAGHDDPMGYSREVDKPSTLFTIYALIIILTLSSVGLSSFGLGMFALPIQLTIAAVQAALVSYFFMHLKQGDRVVILTALASIFWMGILFVLFMADYMTRKMIIGW
jgi:cytochrome c oxidase subunit 4